MNPVEFVKQLNGALSDAGERAEESYQLAMLVKLARIWPIDVRAVKDEFFASRGGEPGSFMRGVLGRSNSGMPDCLHIRRLRVDWREFCSKFTDTEVFKLFRTLARGDNACALVFPISRRTDWVIHNLDVDPEPGVARIVVPAKYGPWAHALPLSQFIKERKQEE